MIKEMLTTKDLAEYYASEAIRIFCRVLDSDEFRNNIARMGG